MEFQRAWIAEGSNGFKATRASNSFKPFNKARIKFQGFQQVGASMDFIGFKVQSLQRIQRFEKFEGGSRLRRARVSRTLEWQ